MEATGTALRRTLLAADLGTWHWDLVSGQRLWSETCAALFGLPPGTTLSYEQFLATLHPDDRDRMRQAIEGAFTRDARYDIEYRVTWPDGTEHWLASKGRVERDAAGRPIRVEGVVQDVTARKRAEEAVREWKDRYEAAILASGHILYDWDERAQRVTFAGSFERTLGYTVADMGDRVENWLSMVHAEDVPSFEAEMARAIDSKTPFHLEYRMRHRDGHYLVVQDDGYPILDATGELARIVGFVANITERKKAESVITEWKDRYEAVILASGHVLYDWDAATDQVTYGGSLERTFGYSAAEMAGGVAVWLTIVHPDDVPLFETEIARSVAEKVPFHLEYRVRHRDGHYIVVQDDGHLILDPAGRVTRTVGFVMDITARRQAEELLRESNERFQLAARATNDAIWDWNLVTNEEWWSESTYRLFGFDARTTTPNLDTWAARIHADDRDRVVSNFNRAIENGADSWSDEYRFQLADGSYRYVLDRALVQRDAGGRPVRVIGAVVDITARRRAEETRALLEAQLRQSQKLQALGTLAGGIAHDFNNVLLAISGNAQLARADLPPDHAVQVCLAEIAKAGDRAAHLVRQILAFSRQEDTVRRPLKLQVTVGEALDLLRATLPAMVEIRAALAPDAPDVLADATQIHQIMMNLGANAAYAMGEDGVLEVRLEPITASAELLASVPDLRPGRYVALTVSDSGCGMDKATLDRIFEPFFTTKPPGRGVGLGLSVVHGIVQSHSGAISVQSVPGEGTMFQLCFPVIAEPTLDEATRATPEASAGGGGHVLFVDDEEALVFLADRTLRRLGYRVTGYTDPIVALQAFRAAPYAFDAVVTDYSMPGLSGPDLARRLLEIRADVPIVMTSGYVQPEDSEAAQRLGVRAVILKPNSVVDLGNTLAELLRQM